VNHPGYTYSPVPRVNIYDNVEDAAPAVNTYVPSPT